MFHLKNFSFSYFPIVILGLISVFHVILVVLLSLALGTGSRGLAPAILLVIGSVVLLVAGYYMLHRLRFPERNKMRNMLTFGILFPATLAHSVLLLIRTQKRNLQADLATLANPQQVTIAVVVLSCVTTFFALVALCLSPFSCDTEPSKISKDDIGSPRKLGRYGITTHYSERLVTLPVKPNHPWDPTKSQSSYAASMRTLNVTTRTIQQHDGFETTYVTWSDVPL